MASVKLESFHLSSVHCADATVRSHTDVGQCDKLTLSLQPVKVNAAVARPAQQRTQNAIVCRSKVSKGRLNHIEDSMSFIACRITISHPAFALILLNKPLFAAVTADSNNKTRTATIKFCI